MGVHSLYAGLSTEGVLGWKKGGCNCGGDETWCSAGKEVGEGGRAEEEGCDYGGKVCGSQGGEVAILDGGPGYIRD